MMAAGRRPGLAGRRYDDRWASLLAIVGVGVVLGGLAVAYQVRHKTTTELAIAAVIGVLGCVVVGRPRQVLLTIVAFDLPLEWGKYLHWNTALAGVGEVPGFQVSLTTLSLAALYALWAFGPRGQLPRRPWLRPVLPLIVYVAANLASLFVASHKALAAYQLEMLTQTLLLVVYVVSTVRTRADLRFLIEALLWGALLESALILAMYLTGVNPSFLGLKNHVNVQDFGRRIGGTFGTPNGAAAYLCLMLPLAMGVVLSERERMRRLAFGVLGLGLIALLITQSRGGWISFAISTVVFGAWAVRTRRLPSQVIVIAAVGLVAVVIGFWGPISQRLNSSDGGSAGSRLSLAREAERVISAHPVLGVGINNYGVVLPHYLGPQFDGVWLFTVHDKYLLVWAEAGIVALLAFVWFLLATLRRAWRCAERCDRTLAPLAVGLGAGVAGQIVHMAVDIFQDRAQVEGLWLVAALLVVIESISRREQRAPSSPAPGRIVLAPIAPTGARRRPVAAGG
jgi:O-antigen ligase